MARVSLNCEARLNGCHVTPPRRTACAVERTGREAILAYRMASVITTSRRIFGEKAVQTRHGNRRIVFSFAPPQPR